MLSRKLIPVLVALAILLMATPLVFASMIVVCVWEVEEGSTIQYTCPGQMRVCCKCRDSQGNYYIECIALNESCSAIVGKTCWGWTDPEPPQ